MDQCFVRGKPESNIVGCGCGPDRLTVPVLLDLPKSKMMALVDGIQGLLEDERRWLSVEQERGNWGFRIAPAFCQSPDRFVFCGRITVVRQLPPGRSEGLQKFGAAAQKDQVRQVRRGILYFCVCAIGEF